MNRQTTLETRIKALLYLVATRQRQLNVHRYLAGFRANHCPEIDVLAAELEQLKAQGREALLDLMNSGISHRAYLQFIQSFEEQA